MNSVHYNVNGIVNNPMKTQIKNVLEELEGVGKVNIDLQRGTVEVDYNAPASESQIRSCIEHVGCRITS